MNNYPSWWDSTVTIYNKYTDPATKRVTWYPHVVHDCFWKRSDLQILRNTMAIESDSTICRIRVNSLFLPDYVWKDLTDEGKTSYFTLGVGDIIVNAEVDDEIDEYTPGKRSSDLVEKYKRAQDCLVIEKSTITVGGGRGLEHYHVRGK